MSCAAPHHTTPNPHEPAGPAPEETDSAEDSLALLAQCGLDVATTPLIALYFSAAWCGPCKGFTPILKQFHVSCQGDPSLANVCRPVFVSFDRTPEQFDAYFQTMTWEAIKFDLQEEREELAEKLKVGGIPCLAILDTRHRRVVSYNARADVQQYASAPHQLTQQWLAKFGEKS